MVPEDDPILASWVERQIRQAQERGEFDDLPGYGKPIPDLDEPYDPKWWIKKWIQREGISPSELAALLRLGPTDQPSSGDADPSK